MAALVDYNELKYGIRRRYVAWCTKEAEQPNFATFYEKVAGLCGVAPRRIQQLALAKRTSLITATIYELRAFAQVLECSPEDLAAEAAERVVAP